MGDSARNPLGLERLFQCLLVLITGHSEGCLGQ